ncbi:hypothetical protein GCM10010210_30970 [Pseudonocardia hydrocarbonoxydans]
MTDSFGNYSPVVGTPMARKGAHAAVPQPRAVPPPPRPPDRPQFEVALRGYDRTAVDAFLDAHVAERQALRHELEASERRRQQAEQRAASTERENRTLREGRAAAPGAPPRPTGDGFGLRVEKLLRLAEQEAGEVRDAAAREATALLEQARARAEQHRHEVEQELITRSTALDQQAAQRAAEQQEREQQIADQLEAARSEAQSLRDAAERAARQRRAEAEAEADAVRARAEAEARRVLEQSRLEADRLAAVQGGARADIARLVDQLAVELGDAGAAGARRGAAAAGAPRAAEPMTTDGPEVAGERAPATASAGR